MDKLEAVKLMRIKYNLQECKRAKYIVGLCEYYVQYKRYKNAYNLAKQVRGTLYYVDNTGDGIVWVELENFK